VRSLPSSVSVVEPDAAQRLKNELAAALPTDPVVATKAMLCETTRDDFDLHTLGIK
jgi:hypothetical protein